jgi:hypothetical protein
MHAPVGKNSTAVLWLPPPPDLPPPDSKFERGDLIGERFGRWTVITNQFRDRRVLSRCDCGVERLVLTSNLCRGLSTSCGCFRREKTTERNTRHGHACRGKLTHAYRSWRYMRQRCFNPRSRDYPEYGGRGIGVCPEWRTDFTAFYRDMGDPPPGKSLDRINNDGDYEPGNCRWATAGEQARNRRPPKRKPRRAKLADIRAYADALARASGPAGGAP